MTIVILPHPPSAPSTSSHFLTFSLYFLIGIIQLSLLLLPPINSESLRLLTSDVKVIPIGLLSLLSAVVLEPLLWALLYAFHFLCFFSFNGNLKFLIKMSYITFLLPFPLPSLLFLPFSLSQNGNLFPLIIMNFLIPVSEICRVFIYRIYLQPLRGTQGQQQWPILLWKPLGLPWPTMAFSNPYTCIGKLCSCYSYSLVSRAMCCLCQFCDRW